MPEPTHPRYLTRSSDRMRAGAAITATVGTDPAVTAVIVDAIDLVSAALLAAAGLTDLGGSRDVLSILWGSQ